MYTIAEKVGAENFYRVLIEDLSNGEEVSMPPAHGAFKKAGRVKKEEGSQGELDFKGEEE